MSGNCNINGINIICNNCFGAALTEEYGSIYENPFMWCAIQPDDYFDLITEWDSLNFSNVETFRLGDVKSTIKTPLGVDDSVLLVLDRHINVFFMHHKIDKNAKKYKTLNHDAYYYDMLFYVKQKWIERSSRMKLPPQFVLRQTSIFTFDRVQRYVDLDTKYQKYLITYDISKVDNLNTLENYCQIEECSIFDTANICKNNNFLHMNYIQ